MAVYHKRQPRPLSSGSLAVYNAIEEYYSLNGCGPSQAEIKQLTGFRSNSVITHHLKRLRDFGWIVYQPFAYRSTIPIRYPRVYYRKAEARAEVINSPNGGNGQIMLAHDLP